MQNIYGVVNSEGVHTDVSNSLRGAKNYATRNRYDTVSVRWNGGYNATIVARKVGNKWKNINNN